MIEHIKKIIDRNKLVSKLPGLLYGYRNEYDKYNTSVYKFGSVKNIDNGNYGLIVNDIEIPKDYINTITDTTDIYINIPTIYYSDISVYGDYFLIEQKSETIFKNIQEAITGFFQPKYYYIEDNNIYEYSKITKSTKFNTITKDNSILHKYLTYGTLHQWYLFFKDYDIQRTSSRFKRKKYSSCMDYFKYELNSIGDSSKYENYDKLYIARGGENFYNFIKNKCIPYYETTKLTNNDEIIEGDYVPLFMYQPQINKWKSWFKTYGDRGTNCFGFYKHTCEQILKDYKPNEPSISGIEDSLISCYYSEWIKKGGDDMYDWLMDKNFIEDASFQTKSSTFHIPLLLTNTINNTGEESILSEEWIPGHLYKNGETFIENEICYQVEDENGYKYNDCTKKIDIISNSIFNRNNINSGMYHTQSTEFSYNEDNVLVFNPTRQRMSKISEITKGYFYNILGNYYDVITMDYIIIKSYNDIPMYYKVDYYSNGQAYCVINDITFIGSKDKILYKSKKCNNNYLTINKNGKFIYYNNSYIKINNDNTITLNYSPNNTLLTASYTYTMYVGRFDYNNKTWYMLTNSTVEYSSTLGKQITDINELNKLDNLIENSFFIDYDNSKAYIIKAYNVYNIDKCSGTTESKLTEFIKLDNLIDNLGNKIKGFFNSTTDINKPYESEILNFTYTLYYISNTDIIDNTYTINIEGNDKKINYLFGNILTNMEFYYYSDYENKNKETITMEKLLNYDTWNSGFTMYCDFTYVIGGIIKLVNDNGDIHYQWIGNIQDESANTDYHTGVIYNETRELELKSEKYYLTNLDYQIIFYIDVKDNYTSIEDESYPNNEYNVNMANFYFYRNIDDINKIFTFDNSYINSPTTILDYNVGISGLKKVESDIYLDRGNSSSLQRHFVLGECLSLEALSQYGNGSLKIINNNNINTI